MIGNKKNSGFTLMEVLVVLSIFLILVVVMTDIFMMILRSQRQTSMREYALSDLRFVTETIARQVRTSEIDYQAELPAAERYFRDGDSGIEGLETEIHLTDIDNNKISYYLDSQSGGTLYTETNGQATPLSSPDQYRVTKLLFFIDPPTSPFSEERCNEGQSGSNGCLNGVSCSLNDQSGPNGYCICEENGAPANEKCATNNCVSVSGAYYCLPYNRQPRVTIVIGFESRGAKLSEQKTIYMQTTAASRVYKR